jgi:hypothetical protein
VPETEAERARGCGIQRGSSMSDMGVDNAHPDSRALRMRMETEPPHAYACAPGMEVEAHETRRCSGGILVLVEAGAG